MVFRRNGGLTVKKGGGRGTQEYYRDLGGGGLSKFDRDKPNSSDPSPAINNYQSLSFKEFSRSN